MIPDEPVRGRTPPPWFHALDGIERARAMTRDQIQNPPLARLLGLRLAHVVPGGASISMPATEASLTGNGQLEIVPAMMAALEAAALTAVRGGHDTVPLRFVIDPFRPAWVRPGNLLFRARVVNSSNLFVFTEVHVEDPDGRHLAQGSQHAMIRRIDPPPPEPPDVLPAVENPTYESPDPYLRSFASSPWVDLMQQHDGMTLMKRLQAGHLDMPSAELYGMRVESSEPGRAVCTIPASEWFCGLRPHVSEFVIAAFADMACWTGALTRHRPDRSIIGLDGFTRFFDRTPADGRPIRGECTLTERTSHLFTADTTIRDADGRLLACCGGSVMGLDPAQRARRHRKEKRRVLATLMFTDIVDSTGHAERLGDERWSTLLDDHRRAVRRELARYNGTEVDTAGDGFFVRFDSPAQAVEAARAAVRAAARLDIAVRAGLHTGECELEGGKPAGMAVHVAARIQGAAGAGEVLVSSTVKDLAVGSSLRFADRGEHTLKGVPDAWHLWALQD